MKPFFAFCIVALLLGAAWLFFYMTQDEMAKNNPFTKIDGKPTQAVHNEVMGLTNMIVSKGRSVPAVGSPEAIKQRALSLGLNLATGFGGVAYDVTRSFTVCHAAEQNGYVIKARTMQPVDGVFWNHVSDDQGVLGWCPEGKPAKSS